jgi:DNA-binding IclR family transcriptional regulator
VPRATPRAGNIALAIQILEQVARSPNGISANRISHELGIPRATVYRIVTSLVQDEFLLRLADLRGFVLGARVVELAHLVAEHRLTPHEELLAGVRRRTGEAVHFARFAGTRIVIVDEDSRHPLTDRDRLTSEPAASAIGHLLLAELPQAEVATLTAEARDVVEQIVAAAAGRGYAQQIGLLSPRRACIAVPVRDRDGGLVGALALSTSVGLISNAARHIEPLREAADALAALPAWA